MKDSFKFIWCRYVWSVSKIYDDLTVLLTAYRIYVVFCLYGIYQAISEHDYNKTDIPIDRWSVLFDIGCIALYIGRARGWLKISPSRVFFKRRNIYYIGVVHVYTTDITKRPTAYQHSRFDLYICVSIFWMFIYNLFWLCVTFFFLSCNFVYGFLLPECMLSYLVCFKLV